MTYTKEERQEDMEQERIEDYKKCQCQACKFLRKNKDKNKELIERVIKRCFLWHA
jgi:hypothetical protein